jgi:hypothetical protein
LQNSRLPFARIQGWGRNDDNQKPLCAGLTPRICRWREMAGSSPAMTV